MSELHDVAFEIWDNLHRDVEADIYDCKLCGEPMFTCMDYTHLSDCPFVKIESAIDLFQKAVDAAEQGAEPEAPRQKKGQPTYSDAVQQKESCLDCKDDTTG